MFSFKITRIVCKNIFPSHFVNRRVLLLQSLNFTLRNARPDLLQSLPYANSSSSHHTSPEESTSYKFTKDTAKRLPTDILAKIIVAGLVGLLSLDLSFAWYWSKNNERLILKTLEKGTKPEAAVANEELVKRPLVVEHLKRIFNPNKNVSNYYMICGEHGAGKTTLTKIASKEVGKGVIYFDVPENPTIEKFGMALGQVLNFTFEEHISFTAQLINKILGIIPGRLNGFGIIFDNKAFDPNFSFIEKPRLEKWERVLEAFKRTSTLYKKKHDRPPVIIYDSISLLIPKYLEILDTLQDGAKKGADKREYVVVFVTSEGSVPGRMEQRSAWSRAKQPVIEIGDLSEEESMEYLTKKRKINEVEAKKLYKLVGGRIVELKSVADDFIAGQSFEVIKQSILTKVKKKFDSANLLRNQSNHEAGKRLIKVLLDSKEIDTDLFREYFKDEKYNEVLEANVFAYHPSRDCITFQSRSIEYYIRENVNIFIKQEL
ncbi:8792_t:CDS:2 [Gigaspora margarita]|uniref:8792_t:CDS:1 n=1 Tax=Gigaspora margarita TaxID=4874 RepID=A0ABN7V2C6_GIGMA|nr:8792_t:CDS:2 [Gigaspora margarita]